MKGYVEDGIEFTHFSSIAETQNQNSYTSSSENVIRKNLGNEFTGKYLEKEAKGSSGRLSLLLFLLFFVCFHFIENSYLTNKDPLIRNVYQSDH